MVLDGWEIANKFRWHVRRHEAPLGAILLVLLATVAMSYLYY